MNAVKMPTASTAMVTISAPDCKNTLAMPATRINRAPMNNHLPMADRSRLMTDDRLAMPRNTTPVPAKAVMMSSAPLARPSTLPTRRDSISPMKKVKASSTGTPAAEFLVFSMANMKPKAPPRNSTKPSPGDRAAENPVATPAQAPSTVGTIDSASSQ